jgi:hypothetical protein
MQSPRLTLVQVVAVHVMHQRNAAAAPSVRIDTYQFSAGRSTFIAPSDDRQVALNTATGRRPHGAKWLAPGFQTLSSSQGDGLSVRTTPSPIASGASILTPRISPVLSACGCHQSASTCMAHHRRIGGLTYRESSIGAWISRLPISHRNRMNHRGFRKRKDV